MNGIRGVAIRGTGRARRLGRGFTLVELMVALAVVAILAAIALPSYTAYVVRGKRAAAKVVLLQTAQAMERYYTANGSYLKAGAFPLAAVAGNCVAVAPMDSNITTHCVTGAATASGGFLLTATPCGDGAFCPAGSDAAFKDTVCDALTIDNTGIKGIGGTYSGTADDCWQK
jgi:type IV pilus assembly protein PilE